MLVDRIQWATSYAKLGGALERPQRALYVLTTVGREILALPEADADARLREMDRQVRAARVRQRGEPSVDEDEPLEDEIIAEDSTWTDVLLGRLHRLAPEGFEEFVMYLLRPSTLN
jgi:restriction system protein